MRRLNSTILEDEINAMFRNKCTLRYPPLFEDQFCAIDIIAQCSKKTYAIKYKGFEPNISNVAGVKSYVDAYEKNMEEDITPVIIFVGKRVRDYVQDFSDEKNVKLIPIKSKRTISAFKGDIYRVFDI